MGEREIERERKTQMDVYQCRRERNRKSPCMEMGERERDMRTCGKSTQCIIEREEEKIPCLFLNVKFCLVSGRMFMCSFFVWRNEKKFLQGFCIRVWFNKLIYNTVLVKQTI